MRDRMTWGFIGVVLIAGIVYTSFEMTPSSYGKVLQQIGAADEGPAFGEARYVRSDEWAMITPFFQAAVRNGFHRINEGSFYEEDLRSCSVLMGLPLKDWSLVFKPDLWAFLVTPPALAYSLHFALVMCACVFGYYFLMLRLGAGAPISAAVAMLIFFSGFFQFWWTTFAPLLAGFPLVLLILLSSLRWWYKALWLSYVLCFCGLSTLYPALFFELAFAALVLILAIEPERLRSPGLWAAMSIGGGVMGLVLWRYYATIIPLMRATEYPGHRTVVPGTATVVAVLSQFLPYISFEVSDYRNLRGFNICEIGAIGSYLPLLTLCLARYRAIWQNRSLFRALYILAVALSLVTLWEIGPAPRLLGQIFFWTMGPSQRLLLVSGFLLTAASVLIWREQSISTHPLRIVIFVLLGPIASAALKMGFYRVELEQAAPDLALGGFVLLAALAACYVPANARAAVLFSAIAIVNILAFGRFNPLQSAAPIFRTSETPVVQQLREEVNASPDHVLVDRRFLGATANGMGFRSVAHALTVPKLDIMRKYFPAMDVARFNYIFNRYCYIEVTNDKMPSSPLGNIVKVPVEAFEPVRNLRQVAVQVVARKDCSVQRGGSVDRVATQDDQLIVEGWAPWFGESPEQQLQVACTHTVKASVSTVRRPDIAERFENYGFARSGFRLILTSSDGRTLRPEDIVLVARNTAQGLAQPPGCGCP